MEQTSRQCKSTSLPKILVMILLCGWDFSLVLICRRCICEVATSTTWAISRTNENMRHQWLEPSQSFTASMPAKFNFSQLRRHAGGEDWYDQSSWPLQCSYQNSIASSTGGHVAFASAAYENQAFWPCARQGKISSFTMFISEHQCKTNVRRFCSLITQIIFFCNS